MSMGHVGPVKTHDMATEDEDSFDTELFIEEIRKLPSIWDYTTAAYSNRNRVEKAKAWETLCSKFYENFQEKDKREKNECAAKLQRKWKSLRDCYNRDLKRNRASKHRKYLYYENLSFLEPLAYRRNTKSTMNDSQHSAGGKCNAQNSSDDSQKAAKRKVSKTTDQENELNKQESSPLSVNHTDSDLHFLLSLYDRFKAIDSDLKVEAQIDILNVIQKYSRPQHLNYDYESFKRYDDHYSHENNTPIERATQAEPPEFQVPSEVSPPEFSEKLYALSPQSVSTLATDDDSIKSEIFT